MALIGDYILCYPGNHPTTKFERNLRIAHRAVELGYWPCVRVFRSDMRAGIVITHKGIDAVNDPHVTEFRDTYYEVDSSLPEIEGGAVDD